MKSDAEIITEFVAREKHWLRVLEKTRESHEKLGKKMRSVQWMGNDTSTHLWLGYYWSEPPYWFGYGWNKTQWLPVIEANMKHCSSNVFAELSREVASGWDKAELGHNNLLRFWAPAEVEDIPEMQIHWFQSRSMELHEFSVTN